MVPQALAEERLEAGDRQHRLDPSRLQAAAEQDVEVIDCESWDYRVGRGVVATVKGQTVLLGNSKLLHEEGVEIWSVDSDPELDVATPIYLAIDGQLVGIHYALDRVRSDTPAMIAELHRRGIEAHMLTGDISSVAHSVAADIGLQPHEVHSDALPDQKAELVQKFTAAGKTPGVDYYCSPTPSNNGYLYNVDSFIFYKTSDPDKQEGQKLLAKLMMGKNFQKVFNLYKGSIPARLDVPMDEFDKCAKTSNSDIKTAGASGGLVPSFAHGMAQGNTMKAALQDVITEHFNSDMSSVDAANALADSVLDNM